MNQLSQPVKLVPAQPPLAGQSVDEDLIDLGRLIRAVMRYKWGILGLAFVITLLSALMVFSMEPVYRASASIVLKSEEANLVNVQQVYTVDTAAYQYSLTQFEILKSRSLAERVVRKLQLHKHPAFLPKQEEDRWYDIDFNLSSLLPASRKEPPVQLSEQEKEAKAIEAVTSMVVGGLSLSQVEYSYVVYLSFESVHRDLAAQIVNTLAEEFINSNLENRLSGTLQATEWLNQRLADLKQNLRASELSLQDFRDREGLVDVAGVTGMGGSELKLLSQRLEESRKARIEAQNIKEDVQGLPSASTDELMTIPAVLQHQTIRELTREQSSAERKVAELGKRYGQRHPKMIAAQADLSAANRTLSEEVRKVVSGISREYDIALRNEQQLQDTWEASKAEVQDFNRKEFQLLELQREVESNRQLYEIFFDRIKNVSEAGGFERPHARIVDRAIVPSSPFKPNKKLSVTLAFILGIMLGCGIAIVLDLLDNTIKSPDDVSEKLHVPLLGSIPKQKTDKRGEIEPFWQKPQSLYAEAIRTIRTGVVLSSLDDPAKVIVVTSTIPDEGKSTIAFNLGTALGQMDNTLVIGADLRRPSLARKCGLDPNQMGLSHFVSGSAKLEECITRMEDQGVYVMPAGIVPPDPLEMISSKRFMDALELLREEFDHIVIDSAPVQAVSDALVLASYADALIYVVKADSTSATLVQKGMASLAGSHAPLTGVVLNQFNPKKADRDYGGRYYQYDSYEQGGNPSSA